MAGARLLVSLIAHGFVVSAVQLPVVSESAAATYIPVGRGETAEEQLQLDSTLAKKGPSPTPPPPPTPSPTPLPTSSPTRSPTRSPTSSPTALPTPSPTLSPTRSPTASPTASPTSSPTSSPTASPTSSPTPSPTASPTSSPTLSPTNSPTLSPTPCVDPTCLVYEDPHITVFDGAQVALVSTASVTITGGRAVHRSPNGYGQKWLVKSTSVLIQGKYASDMSLPEKNAFMQAIAVGGPILKNNVLLIGSLAEGVTWNGHRILASMPSEFEVDGLLIARNYANSSLVQDRTKSSPGLEVSLPSGVRLLVNRYKSHVNIAITMKHTLEQQDGLCGNFNSFPGDDLPELVDKRTSEDVEATASLFA